MEQRKRNTCNVFSLNCNSDICFCFNLISYYYCKFTCSKVGLGHIYLTLCIYFTHTSFYQYHSFTDIVECFFKSISFSFKQVISFFGTSFLTLVCLQSPILFDKTQLKYALKYTYILDGTTVSFDIFNSTFLFIK